MLAAAGLGSRRQCEELITAGRVEVDRRVVTELGTRVDPAQQAIRVDGVALHTARLEYFAVNKPSGVLCTNRDPSGRTRVVDLIDARGARLFTIGRLDLHSEGLILVTNDGELANRLTHPRYGVRRRIASWWPAVRRTRCSRSSNRASIWPKASPGPSGWRSNRITRRARSWRWCLREGKNREIRRLLARVGHKVLRLTRIAVGPVRLGSLPTGAVRRLTADEIKALRQGRRGEAAARCGKTLTCSFASDL